MIKNIKKYKCEEPLQEIWKNLKYFSFVPNVEKIIKENYPKASKNNILKQATQVSYCIRQAEEYFKAAKYVNLTTKPLLMYYGAVSLANSLVLIKNDGTYSIDYLRNQKKHKHHGLELTGDIDRLNRKSEIENILDSINCCCYTKNYNNQNIPWGQFPLFYNALVQTVISYTLNININNIQSLLRNETLFCSEKKDLSEYLNCNFNILDLVKNLPDLYYNLADFNIIADLKPGEIKHNRIENIKNDKLSNLQERFDFYINGLSSEDKDSLIKFYKDKNPEIKINSEYEHNIHFFFEEILELKESDEVITRQRYLPDIVDDINGDFFYIVKPDTYILEPVSMYIILYCFGMISRYYPDIWMKLVDNNSLFSEFMLAILNMINRKFPNLILDQLTNTKYQFNGA